MNQVNIIGNIGTEPVFISFGEGKRLMRFSVAINRRRKNGDSLPTTWIPCESWDETAERFLKCAETGKLAGRKIQITGSLCLNEYERQLGDQKIKERKLYVKVYQFSLISKLQDEQVPVEPKQEPVGETSADANKPENTCAA